MAVREQLFHIAVCDICGAECDEAGGIWLWETTRAAAIEQATEAPGWTAIEGGLVCGVSDRGHDEARGGDSPLLQPTRDAMAVEFREAS
ncbi:hypothetical protein [Streptomyces sp. NPDC005303]|uniref:hypothetical protein n=1 Tax=Streptomyces sp. NPDC005303 TaxID=3155713 RepID=UPI0033A6870D